MNDETKIRILIWLFIIGVMSFFLFLTWLFCQIGLLDCTPTNITGLLEG